MSAFVECSWCRGHGCLHCGWWGLTYGRESSVLDLYPPDQRTSWSATAEDLASLSPTVAAVDVEGQP